MLFKAKTAEHVIEDRDNQFIIPITDEVEAIIDNTKTWVKIGDLKIGDKLSINDNEAYSVKNITRDSNNYLVTV